MQNLAEIVLDLLWNLSLKTDPTNNCGEKFISNSVEELVSRIREDFTDEEQQALSQVADSVFERRNSAPSGVSLSPKDAAFLNHVSQGRFDTPNLLEVSYYYAGDIFTEEEVAKTMLSLPSGSTYDAWNRLRISRDCGPHIRLTDEDRAKIRIEMVKISTEESSFNVCIHFARPWGYVTDHVSVSDLDSLKMELKQKTIGSICVCSQRVFDDSIDQGPSIQIDALSLQDFSSLIDKSEHTLYYIDATRREESD